MNEKEITPHGVVNATDAELALEVSSDARMIRDRGLIRILS
jgi:hypothetical protein